MRNVNDVFDGQSVPSISSDNLMSDSFNQLKKTETESFVDHSEPVDSYLNQN